MKKELRWVTTNKHNSPAAGATQGYMCLFATVMRHAKKQDNIDNLRYNYREFIMKQKRICKLILIALIGFLALGAFYGGIVLIISPDGSFFNMPLDLLSNSPFKTFLIPGIILLTTFGIFPIFVIYGLIRKPKSKFFNKLNLLYDYHFAWTFAIYIGLGQIIWINVQTFIFNSVDIIHTIYSSLGILIICISLLPQTRKNYKQ